MERDLFFLTNNLSEIWKEKIAKFFVFRALKQEEFSKILMNCKYWYFYLTGFSKVGISVIKILKINKGKMKRQIVSIIFLIIPLITFSQEIISGKIIYKYQLKEKVLKVKERVKT